MRVVFSEEQASRTLFETQGCNYRAVHNAFIHYFVGSSWSAMEGVYTKFVFRNLLLFFCGEIVENCVPDTNLITEIEKLLQFILAFGDLRSSTRTSTHMRHYVISVWVDCPRYQVLLNHKVLDLPALLDNALGTYNYKLRNLHLFV